MMKVQDALILERIIPDGCLYGIDVGPIEPPNTIARIKHAGYEPRLGFAIASAGFAKICRFV